MTEISSFLILDQITLEYGKIRDSIVINKERRKLEQQIYEMSKFQITKLKILQSHKLRIWLIHILLWSGLPQNWEMHGEDINWSRSWMNELHLSLRLEEKNKRKSKQNLNKNSKNERKSFKARLIRENIEIQCTTFSEVNQNWCLKVSSVLSP